MRSTRKGQRVWRRFVPSRRPRPFLVTISLLAAVGPSSGGRLRSEGDPAAPVSAYGRSKRAGEIAAQAVCRPRSDYGGPAADGARRGRPQRTEALQVHRALPLPSRPRTGLARYSVVHVADLVEGILLAGKRGRRLLPACQEEGERADTGCYFLAGREHPTYRELGQMVKAALCRPYVPIVPMPMPIVWLIASTGEIAGRLRGRALSEPRQMPRSGRRLVGLLTPTGDRRTWFFPWPPVGRTVATDDRVVPTGRMAVAARRTACLHAAVRNPKLEIRNKSH